MMEIVFLKEMMEKMKATDRGTLVHLFLELYPLDKELNFEECFQNIIQRSLFNEEARTLLNQYKVHLESFIESDVYQLMLKSSYCYKEKEFSFLNENKQIIHGIFDVLCINEDKITIIDYKTDTLAKNSSDELLKELHQGQMYYYKKIMKQMFPNKEVEEGFINFLMPFYTRFNKIEAPFEIQKFVREIRTGQLDAFFNRLKSFLADTPYELISEQERHYQNVLFIIFKLVGFYTEVEYHTSEGRVDLVLKTNDYIYIMEFKLNGSAEEALQQIHDKHYAQPFQSDKRKIFRIGVNFSSKTRNIEKWIVES